MQILEQHSGNGFENIQGYLVPGLASVIMPAYNHAGYIQEAIQSVIRQTYRPIEVLLFDDGSSDNTYPLALHSLQASGLPYWIIKKQNQGSCVTGINHGLSLSHGEFVSILSGDDIYYPEKLQSSIGLLQQSDALLVLGQDASMRHDGSLIAGTETNLDVFRYWYEQGCLLKRLYLRKEPLQFPYLGLVFRKEAFDILGYYDPFTFTEDYEMLFRVAYSKIRIAFLTKVVGIHRSGSRSVEYSLRVSQSTERVLRRYAPTFWLANRALAYNEVQEAMLWWKLDKKRAIGPLLRGIFRYPFVVSYIFSMLYYVLNKRNFNC